MKIISLGSTPNTKGNLVGPSFTSTVPDRNVCHLQGGGGGGGSWKGRFRARFAVETLKLNEEREIVANEFVAR